MQQLARLGPAGTPLHLVTQHSVGVAEDGGILLAIEIACHHISLAAIVAADATGQAYYPVATLAPDEPVADNARRLYAECIPADLLCGDCCAALLAELRVLEEG